MCERGEFLEWAEKFGYSYGTIRQPVEAALSDGKLVILEIDVEGATKVKAQMPESSAIFILPPSEDALLDRLRRRGRDTEEEIRKRFSNARQEIAYAMSSGIYDSFVVNADLETVISEMLDWIRCEIPQADV